MKRDNLSTISRALNVATQSRNLQGGSSYLHICRGFPSYIFQSQLSTKIFSILISMVVNCAIQSDVRTVFCLDFIRTSPLIKLLVLYNLWLRGYLHDIAWLCLLLHTRQLLKESIEVFLESTERRCKYCEVRCSQRTISGYKIWHSPVPMLRMSGLDPPLGIKGKFANMVWTG